MMPARHAAECFIGFFLPSRCSLCGGRVVPEGGSLCGRCASGLNRVDSGCPVCGASGSGDVCPDCGDRAVYYERNVSLYRYEGAAKKMIFSLKRGTHPQIGRFLGKAAAAETATMFQPDLVTFVPVSAKRKRERGYNQAEIIARSLGKGIKKPVKELLRVRESGNQKSMHYNERFLNMIGRFSGEGDDFCRGRTVLLVDDVFTTGATVNECARILKKMGASSVFSLTIARVDNKKVAVAASVGYNSRQ